MISKVFNKVAAKTFANKSKAHVFQPKSINLYFPNSIDKEFKSLSLNSLSAVNFYIKKEIENPNYILAVQMYSCNNMQEINIASFVSNEEAEDALNEVRVVLYAPMKSFAKWLTVLTFIGALVCMTSIHMNGLNSNWSIFKTEVSKADNARVQSPAANYGIPGQSVSSGSGIVAPPMPTNVNPGEIPPPVSEGEIDNIIGQLQQVKQLQENVKRQQGGQDQAVQQPENTPQQQEQQTNPADQFLKGLD